MFDGFETHTVPTQNAQIYTVIGGEGPPLLLLHGYPQTHAMWHKVAERLKTQFTLVIPDLRGYGRSSKLASVPDHMTFSKRAIALDMVQVMDRLGHSQFYLGSHDRGARVSHRLVLDHPDKVLKVAMLDIAPTREMYANTDFEFAKSYWHWFLLIQPAPFPENLISQDPKQFWLKKCGAGSAGLSPFTPDALEDYLTCFSDFETIRCSCEDYRAAATIDLVHDEEDNGKKIECPLLVLWGKNGVIEKCFDALTLWKQRAIDVRGWALPGGHYLAEELPDKVTEAFCEFFTD